MIVKTELEPSVEAAAVPKSTTLWLVDDSKVYRELLVGRFRDESDIHPVRQFSSAEAAIAGLIEGPAPDVILLDVQMGGMSGLDAVRPIKAIARETRIIILTTFRDHYAAATAFDAGASGYLSKLDEFAEILDWIRNPHKAQPRFDLEASRLRESTRASTPWIKPDRVASKMGFLQRLFRFTSPAAKT